jgi:hypothetical protein
VLTLTALLRGRPGLVSVHARDAGGGRGRSLLEPETLELRLAPGPMAGLAFEEPGSRACGMRGVLPALRVLAVDDFGNPTACGPPIEACAAPGPLPLPPLHFRSCLAFQLPSLIMLISLDLWQHSSLGLLGAK